MEKTKTVGFILLFYLLGVIAIKTEAQTVIGLDVDSVTNCALLANVEYINSLYVNDSLMKIVILKNSDLSSCSYTAPFEIICIKYCDRMAYLESQTWKSILFVEIESIAFEDEDVYIYLLGSILTYEGYLTNGIALEFAFQYKAAIHKCE